MEISIPRSHLHQALSAVTAALPAKTTLPVLSNVLIEAEKDALTISATDLDISIRTTLPASVAKSGSLTVPGKKLQDIVRLLPDQPVRISSRRDQATVECGKSKLTLNGMPAEEFPGLQVVDYDGGATLGGDLLSILIARTLFAVSTEESRPILNAVLWEITRQGMTLVATNGHRLARASAPMGGDQPQHYIVPPAAFKHVDRLFKGEEKVTIGKSGNVLGFRAGPTEIHARLIDGQYPNYNQVIPKGYDRFAVLNRAAFEQAVRRMAVVANSDSKRIRIGFSGDAATLSVLTPDLGEGKDLVSAHVQGDAIEIGFNAAYLLEVLSRIPTEDVRISFASPERATVVEPVDEKGDVMDDYLCIVMPLRLLD